MLADLSMTGPCRETLMPVCMGVKYTKRIYTGDPWTRRSLF